MSTDTITRTDGSDSPDTSTHARGVPVRQWLRRTDKCSLAALVLAVLFGCVFAVVTPAFWSADEPTHFGRAYAVDHGHLLPQRMPELPDKYGGWIPATAAALENKALANLAKLPSAPLPQIVDPDGYRRLAAQPLRPPLTPVGFVNTSAYSPVAYLPSAVGLRLTEMVNGSVGTAVTLMRICDVLAFAALVWLALRALRQYRLKWLVFVVSLLPMTVYEASVITADALTNGLAILFGALFAKATFLKARLSMFETVLLGASAILLPLAKPTYVILALLLLVVPAAQLPVWRHSRLLVSAVGLAGFATWTKLSAGTAAGMGIMRPGEVVDAGQQTHYVLTHLPQFLLIIGRTVVYQSDGYLAELFGTLSWTFFWVPAPAIISCTAAGVIALGMAGRLSADRWRLIATAVLVLANFAAVFATLYLSFTPVGKYQIEGVQGRYFIPIAVVAMVAFAQFVPLRLHLPTPRTAQRCATAVAALMSVALSSSALAFAYVVWH